MMKILLINDSTVSDEFLSEVKSLLNGLNGPLQFEVAPFSMNEIQDEILSWTKIFKEMDQFINQYSLVCDLAFLLTAKPNERNFFGYVNPQNRRDAFVHAGDWESYLECPEALPVAYHIMALFIQRNMFEAEHEVVEYLHRNPIGCVNDFCENKQQVILKMRTGDICSKCMEKILKKLSLPMMGQVMDILESLRLKMLFSQNMKQFVKPSRLELTANYNLLFPDFANLEIKLRPLEKVLYAIFYRNPDGFNLSDLIDHHQEMMELYLEVSGVNSLQDARQSVNDLCNIYHNSTSEKLSRIRKEIERHLGKRLAENYVISGGRSEKRKIKILSNPNA